MMENNQKKNFNPKEHPFVSGCVLTFAVCAVFGGMYYKLDSCRIDDLKEDITRLKQYEDKYKEGIIAQEQLSLLQGQFAGLESRYNALIQANWEQKYEAERISNTALNERYELDENRYNDELTKLRNERDELRKERNDLEFRLNSIPTIEEKTVGDGLKAFDELLIEKKMLQEDNNTLKQKLELQMGQLNDVQNQLITYQNEVTKLRELVNRTSSDNISKNSSKIANSTEIDMICIAIEGMGSDKLIETTVLQQITTLNKQIPGDEFLRILKAAKINSNTVKGNIIISSSKFLVYPIPPKVMKSIITDIGSDTIQSKVIQTLTKAQAAYIKNK